MSASAPSKRLGAVFAVEGDRWMVTLGGRLGEYPPADDAGFLEFAQGFPVPDVHRAIAHLIERPRTLFRPWVMARALRRPAPALAPAPADRGRAGASPISPLQADVIPLGAGAAARA